MKMDSSEYESDAGASPTVSESDADSVSSCSSSPGTLKIVCQTQATPKKRTNTSISTSVGVNAPTSQSKPTGSNRKPTTRKRNGSSTAQSSQKIAPQPSSNTKATTKPSTSKQSLNTEVGVQSRKRKQQQRRTPNVTSTVTPTLSKPKPRAGAGDTASSTGSPTKASAKRPRMNQRRRTKSERNSRAGKVSTVPAEESVALDAEIDKFLEEKAMKNNLTATNVKSIIRHVITNNMVQKMIMSTGRKKGNKTDGDSSDDETYFEPKLTRARTKLLLGDQQSTTPLWPSLASSSPNKSKNQEISETHVLIHEELPEDDGGDADYCPFEHSDGPTDILETHSDDENSSVISHTSDATDVGSPYVSAVAGGVSSRRKSCDVTQGDGGGAGDNVSNCKSDTIDNLFLFKTPPPVKPKSSRRTENIEDNAIGLRTRSKLPLNDTTLESLERQLIPPDITPGMYDFDWSQNNDAESEEYLKFLNDFVSQSQNNEAGDDDEADPEYNVMEDEEVHDKEELRMDRAVKVSKKELNGLVEELLEENHFTSGDELDQNDFSSFCISQLAHHMSMTNVQNFTPNAPETPGVRIEESKNGAEAVITVTPNVVKDDTGKKVLSEIHLDEMARTVAEAMISLAETNTTVANVGQPFQHPAHPCPPASPLKPASIVVEQGQQTSSGSEIKQVISDVPLAPMPPGISIVSVSPVAVSQNCVSTSAVEQTLDLDWFSKEALETLKYQMIQHIQLMAQSYVLTACRDHPYFKNIALNSKRMINELRNLGRLNGPDSNFLVVNLEPAWQLVNSWPVKSKSKSPLKTKKILEEKYLNDHLKEKAVGNHCATIHASEPFPRQVVKVIAENRAFVYPELLPQFYNQNSLAIVHFTTSEDILLVYGLEDLKDAKFSTQSKCKLISETLLVSRSSLAVYHRMRNLKKTLCNRSPAVKDYFLHGILPPSAAPAPTWNRSYNRPISSQPQERICMLWVSLLAKLLLPESRWDSFRKPKKKISQKRKPKKETCPKKLTSPKQQVIVTSTFPAGMSMVQQKIEENPDLASFPILNSNGDPGAYMFIPKYALTAPGYNKSPKGTEANIQRKFYHPVPFYDVEKENGQQTSRSKNEDNSMIGLTPVGKPFTISGVDIKNDVVCLDHLETPLKKAILEHIQDSPTKCSPTSPERMEHSARTVGNFVAGSAQKKSPLKDDSHVSFSSIRSSNRSRSMSGSSSSSSSSSSDIIETRQKGSGVVEEEDVNLTDYEDNLNAMNDASFSDPTLSSTLCPEIVRLEEDVGPIVVENEPLDYETTAPMDVKYADDSVDTKQNTNDTQKDKENSGDGGKSEKNLSVKDPSPGVPNPVPQIVERKGTKDNAVDYKRIRITPINFAEPGDSGAVEENSNDSQGDKEAPGKCKRGQSSEGLENSPCREVSFLQQDDRCLVSHDTVHDTEIITLLDVEEAGESGDTKQNSNDTQGDKENSGDGKKGQSSENHGNAQESASTSGRATAPASSGQGSSGNGDKGDGDDKNERRPRKNTRPAEILEQTEKDKEEDTEVTEDEPDTSGGHSNKGSKAKKPERHLKSRNQRIPKHPSGRSHKRSPATAPTAPKKRSSKTVPIEKMLEEDKQRDVEVCEAFMQAFLSNVQSTTEKKHPGLHNEFLKVLAEAGENNESQQDLLAKIQNLLKDYPELIREFSTFVESDDLDNSVPPCDDAKFEDYQELQAQLNFISLLEKFTEKSPQLKTKILHKFKVLKEGPALSEKEVAEGLAPFFQGNPVMLDAFKALFPSVYRPQSIDPGDFEEIDLESEEPQQNLDSELVKLPDEKSIPATNSCPCHCHENATHSYTSRVKHCNKCCIKDGKVFVHNGRVVRPVNVELTSPTAARKIISGNSCINCVPESSTSKVKECLHVHTHAATASSSKHKDESDAKRAKLEIVSSIKAIHPAVLVIENNEVEEGEIVDEEEVHTNKGPDSHNIKFTKDAHGPSTSKGIMGERIKDTTKVNLNKPWTIEEDRIILETVQSEGKFEHAFHKLSSKLKQRDITEIESRCVELLSLLQQSIKNAAASGGSSDIR